MSIAVLWGALTARYPQLGGPVLTVDSAGASDPVLRAILVALAVGAALIVPSMIWLYVLFQRR